MYILDPGEGLVQQGEEAKGLHSQAPLILAGENEIWGVIKTSCLMGSGKCILGARFMAISESTFLP